MINWYGVCINEFGRRPGFDAPELEEAREDAGSGDEDTGLHFLFG